jgi:hypothetical protein
MKTRQEVEQLRIAWVTEPWDDLETTEGYGEYFVELILFRRKMEKIWADRKEKRHKQLESYICPMMSVVNLAKFTHCQVEKCALWNNTMDLCSLAVDADIKAEKHNREY